MVVRLKNIRPGHNSHSLTNVRQMWVKVTARDERGNVIMTTGTVEPDGSLPDDIRNFNSDGMNSDVHFAIDPWIVTAFSCYETNPPRVIRRFLTGLQFRPGSRNLTSQPSSASDRRTSRLPRSCSPPCRRIST